jgi:hypothetical protein
LTFTNINWRCRAPISSYAVDGMPLHVVVNTTNAASRNWNVNGAIRFDDGCRGDGDPSTIDITVNIAGNGADIGPAGDALVLAGGTDIDLGPSRIDCGAGGAQGGHEDAFRANRGHRLTMYGLETGDWDSLTPTCHGAGGNLYYDNVNGSPAGTTNVRCVECKIVASAGVPEQQFGVGAGYGWSTDSGSIRNCLAAVRPNWHYMSGGQPIAVRAIDVDNFTIQFATGTNTPLSGQPPASACPLP